MKKIRWGVLSTAKIAITKVIPAMQQGRYTQVTAIASRELRQAQLAASRLEVAKVYGSYEALLADPDIDAVYIPLPNHLHVPWAIRALEAGKHVLCEKPIALSSAETRTLIEAAARYPHLKVMEAFMYRFHPQWQRARQIVLGGGIGELRTIHSFFSYFNDDPANIRNVAELGGGGLMDIGCYNISLSRWMFGAEPRRVCGLVEYDPEFNTDRLASAMLDFGGGSATFTCSTQLTNYQRVLLFGTAGRIEIEIPFNPSEEYASRLWHQRGATIDALPVDNANHYTRQGDAFALAILSDSPVPAPLDDALANMRVLEAVVASARSNAWVALE
ncbi:MAG TPA: Gfo/Idh/MocA family oxidoreductase [Herpetosiphonaceae bacterium]|nr:Gfo/Idh/MocA family oxidoreductase [Herpetosiphonaceae bacterium]